jgi:hypothetical protein
VFSAILVSISANEQTKRCSVIPVFDSLGTTNTYRVTLDSKDLSVGLSFDLAMKVACLMHENNECTFINECIDENGNDVY